MRLQGAPTGQAPRDIWLVFCSKYLYLAKNGSGQVGIPDITEKELLARCIQGDKQGWDTFVVKYSKLIYFALWQTLKHKNPPVQPEEIEDLYQEVFCSLMEHGYKKLRQFEGKNGCSLANWVRIIAVRKAIDHLRKERRTEPFEKKSDNGENTIEGFDERWDPEEELIKSQQVEIIAEVIRKLHPRDQLFIELYYRRQLPTEEIAQIMKLDPNAVYQLHYRVRERMKKILSEEYPDLAAA
ncbi:MAG: RNA polymerase sigma factor [Candidatus Hodarchaeota archaeon]